MDFNFIKCRTTGPYFATDSPSELEEKYKADINSYCYLMCLTVCILTLFMKLIRLFFQAAAGMVMRAIVIKVSDCRHQIYDDSSSLHSQCPSISWAEGHWVICNVGLFLSRTLQARPHWGLQNTWIHGRKGRRQERRRYSGYFWRANLKGETSPAISR